MNEDLVIMDKSEDLPDLKISKYTKKDGLIAILCFVPAYIFIKNVLFFPYSLWTVVFNLIFLSAILCSVKISGVKFKNIHIGLFAVSLAFNVPFILTDNAMPKVLAGMFSFCLMCYTLFTVTSGREIFERNFLGVFLQSMLKVPFRGFNDSPMSIGELTKNTVSFKKAGK